MMANTLPAQTKNAQAWYMEEFLPWQAASQKYANDKLREHAKLKQHAQALYRIIGLLLEGKGKQAMQSWNALGLAPRLAEIVVSKNGETLTLRTTEGSAQTLQIDDLITDLQKIVSSATPLPAPAGGS